MQFHLNGFQPGDPTITPATGTEQTDQMPAEVDVLIVGSGSAGLTLAAQLSAFPDFTTRLIEAKAGLALENHSPVWRNSPRSGAGGW